MKITRAFTILEMLISMSLSAVIFVGMLQIYRNIVTTLGSTHEMLNTNRKACLLFNELERDFNTAFIPFGYKSKSELEKEVKEKADKGEKVEGEKTGGVQSKDDEKKKKEEELERLKKFFIVKDDEFATAVRLQNRLWRPFKMLSLVCTNPLQVYGQRRARFVRIIYELVKDKQKSKGDNEVFTLWRKETDNIDNINAKDPEISSDKEKPEVVRTYLVADNIKSMFVELVLRVAKKQEELRKDKIEFEEKRFFNWAEKEETKGIVPTRVEVSLEFWNEAIDRSYAIQAVFPVISFPSFKDEKKKKKKEKQLQEDAPKEEKKDKDATAKPGENKPAEPAVPGQPPAEATAPSAPVAGGEETGPAPALDLSSLIGGLPS